MAKKGNRKVSRLLENPYVRNALMILGVILVISFAMYLAMAFGTRHGNKIEVPNFTGISIRDAVHFADRRDLQLIVNDSLYVPQYEGGMILDQLPKPGVGVKKGRKVYVTINSFSKKKVPLPYVARRSLRQAKNMIETAGVQIQRLEYVPDIASNYVLAEIYDGVEVEEDSHLIVPQGSYVTLRVGVSENEYTTKIPNVIGKSLREAKSILFGNGLNFGSLSQGDDVTRFNLNDARVYYQSDRPGATRELGSSVSLGITVDEKKIADAIAEMDAILSRVEDIAEPESDVQTVVAPVSSEAEAEKKTETRKSTTDDFFD